MSVRHPGRPKKTSPKPKCKVLECEKVGVVRGFCQTHYTYFHRGDLSEDGIRLREPQRIAKYAPDAKCILPGCGEFPRSRGMCNKHMLQRQAGIIDEQGNQLRELAPFTRPRTKDRWVGQQGYVLVQAPLGHPFARQDGTILEHRLVMEQHLGCYLDPDEFLVHHKDGDRSNNVPANLEVMSARKASGEGHPPGSAIPLELCVQVLLQQVDLPDGLRQWLEFYKASVLTNRVGKS